MALNQGTADFFLRLLCTSKSEYKTNFDVPLQTHSLSLNVYSYTDTTCKTLNLATSTKFEYHLCPTHGAAVL